MASAYGGHNTLPTVTASAEVQPCGGLTLATIPATSSSQSSHHQNNSNNLRPDAELQLVETENSINQQRLQQSELLVGHLQQQQQHHHHQLNSGISETENVTNSAEGRSNGSLAMHSFSINPHNGRSSPTASGSSGGGSRSSAHSLPSHSPALHHNNHLSYQTQVGPLDSCGGTTVVTSAAIMGRLTAGCMDSIGSAGSAAGFSTIDNCGSDSLSLLQHHPHTHHFSYSSLPPPHHHHHHLHSAHHPHDTPGLLDISTL